MVKKEVFGAGQFLGIAGNMGGGKSTFINLFTQRFVSNVLPEDYQNPYFERFYQESKKKWSYLSQASFLADRASNLQEFQRKRKNNSDLPHPTLQDRTIYEDAQIFAQNLYNKRKITDDDFELYLKHYQIFSTVLPAPDLIVYFQASVPTLVKRIGKRRRKEEKKVSIKYIEQLNELYEIWASSFTLSPILTIPTDELNIVKSENDFQYIVGQIRGALLPKRQQ